MGHVGEFKAFVMSLPFSRFTKPLILTHIVSFSYQHIYIRQFANKSMAMDSNVTLPGLHLLLIYMIFSCYFYLVLGSIQFHVSHWVLFNERHWFALINSSLITMKLSLCVFTMVTQLESRHSCLCTFWWSEQKDEEYLNKPYGISFIIHSQYVSCSLNNA